MLIPTVENVTLFSDFIGMFLPFSLTWFLKVTFFFNAVNKAWNMPAPYNQW